MRGEYRSHSAAAGGAGHVTHRRQVRTHSDGGFYWTLHTYSHTHEFQANLPACALPGRRPQINIVCMEYDADIVCALLVGCTDVESVATCCGVVAAHVNERGPVVALLTRCCGVAGCAGERGGRASRLDPTQPRRAYLRQDAQRPRAARPPPRESRRRVSGVRGAGGGGAEAAPGEASLGAASGTAAGNDFEKPRLPSHFASSDLSLLGHVLRVTYEIPKTAHRAPCPY